MKAQLVSGSFTRSSALSRRASVLSMAGLFLLMMFASILTAARFAQDPAGSIAGTLQTMDGKPAAGVRVSAMSTDSNLQTSAALMNIGQTDVSGGYKLENVRPGRYYVVAGFIDVPSFFPGVRTQDAATVVTVGPGEAVTGIDFRMAVPIGLRFTGRIIREDAQGVVIPSGPAGAPFQLLLGAPATQPSQVRLMGSPPGTPAPSAVVAADGTFEIANLRPGTYQIDTPPVPPAAPNMRRSITLVDADITNYELIVPMMAQLQGTVIVEGGGPVPRLQLELTSTSPPRPSQPAPPRLNAAANFTTRLQLGEYRISAAGLPTGFVIRSMKAGGTDLLTSPLQVTTSEAPQIAIVLGVTSPSPYVSLSGRVFGRARRENVVNLNIMNATSPGILEPIFYLDGTFEVPMTLPGEHRIRTGSLPSYGSLNSTTLVGPAGSTDGRLFVIDEGPSPTIATDGSGSGVRVLGRIAGHTRLYPGSRIRLREVTLGEALSTSIFMDGTFEFPRVPQGSYSAEVLPSVPGASPTSVVVGNSDVRDLRVIVPDTREIAGRVSVPAGYTLPRTLAFSAAAGEPVRVILLPDGSFRTTLPEKQRIAVTVDSLPPSYSVDSMTYGALNLLDAPFAFSGKAGDELRVTLRTTQRTSRISGQVAGFPALPPESRMWLVDSAGVHQTQETGIAADGTFAFSAVTPGSYIARLIARGIPSTVGTTQVVNVTGSDAELRIMLRAGAAGPQQ